MVGLASVAVCSVMLAPQQGKLHIVGCAQAPCWMEPEMNFTGRRITQDHRMWLVQLKVRSVTTASLHDASRYESCDGALHPDRPRSR